MTAAWSGERPVEWLQPSPRDSRWCPIHATHLTPQETMKIAASGAVAGLCLTTEANLGDGIFPGPQYLEHNGVWEIGSGQPIFSVGRQRGFTLVPNTGSALIASAANWPHRPRREPHVGNVLYQGRYEAAPGAKARNIGQLSVGYQSRSGRIG